MLRGKNNVDLCVRYVMEGNESSQMYATYLVSHFSNRATASSVKGFYMADNEEVMAIWVKFSSEGMTRIDTYEHLRVFYDRI